MASALRGGGGGGSAPAVLEAAASMQPGQGGQLEQGSTTTTLGGLLFRMLQEAIAPTSEEAADTPPTEATPPIAPAPAGPSSEVIMYSYKEQAAYLTILYAALIMGIAYFLLRYANRSLFKWHTYFNIAVAYFTALGLLLLVPLDLAVTKLTRLVASEAGYEQLVEFSNSLYNCYGALFWPTQIFASVLLVFFEEYNESGHYTVGQRCWDAFKNIGRFLALGLVAGGILLAILLCGGYATDESALLVTVVALNNTYGLVVIVLLLGYGLVELPKQMWMNGNLQGKLRRLRGKAAHEFRALSDASMDMSEAVAHTLKTKAEVERLKDPALVALLPRILKLVPDEFHTSAGGQVQKDAKGKVTLQVLAELRKLIKKRYARYLMCQSRVERLKREVFALEDIVAAKHRADRVPRIHYASGAESSVPRFFLECYVRPIASRLLSLGVIALCLTVLLAEVGLYAGAHSPVAILSRGNHDPAVPPGRLIVLNLFYIGFIGYVMLFALSQLRVADVMEIAPEQKTTPRSMSFNARLCCKLAPPLAFNFLTLCFESGVQRGPWMRSRLTGADVSSAFSRFYGSMDIIPFLGDNFNRAFPILIALLAVFQVFNVFNRLLQALQLEWLQFGDPPISNKDMKEGLKKLQKYRQQMEAASQREERMRKIRGATTSLKDWAVEGKDGGAVGKVTPLGATDDLQQQQQQQLDGDESEEDEVLPGYGDRGAIASRYNPAAGPPPVKEGMMEKKTGRETVGGGWESRYFEIKYPGTLVHYKKKDKAGPVLGSLDLAGLIDARHPQGKTGGLTDATRLNVETGGGTLKLRCRSEDQAAEWRRALLDWRAYCVAYKQGALPAVYHAATAAAADETHDAATSSLNALSDLASALGAKAAAVVPPSVTSIFGGAAASAAATTTAAGGSVVRGGHKKPVMPNILSGRLQLQSGLFGQLAEKSFAVKPTDGTLKHYKLGASTAGAAQGSIALTSIDRVAFEEPRGPGAKRDPTRFVVYVYGKNDPALRLKALTPADAERWVTGLTKWVAYSRAALPTKAMTLDPKARQQLLL